MLNRSKTASNISLSLGNIKDSGLRETISRTAERYGLRVEDGSKGTIKFTQMEPEDWSKFEQLASDMPNILTGMPSTTDSSSHQPHSHTSPQ